MSNLLQKKIEQFKMNAKQRKYTRKDAAVGASVALILTAICGLSSFNPGVVHYSPAGDKDKKVSIAEFSKLAGPQQDIEMEEKNPLKRKMQKAKPQTEKTQTSSFGGFSTSGSFGSPFAAGAGIVPHSTTSLGGQNLEKSRATYARHTELSNGMKALLNSSFSLKNMSGAPTGREDRFTTSYEYKNGDGAVLERFELMSIVRDSRMDSIKTARQALDSLVEESQAINVIESTDDYLIYDFAGDGGYQIGKISVDDKGIYIFGYVNLTTSEMPDVLKAEWIDHYRNSLK